MSKLLWSVVFGFIAVLFYRVSDLTSNQELIIENQQLLLQNQTEIVKQLKYILVKTNQRVDYVDLDSFCLAKNIYHEARGEELLGKYAVAQVTINRWLKSKNKTLCHIVLAPKQFSWTNDKSLRWSHPEGVAWDEAKMIAKQVLVEGYRVRGLEEARFYHADYVNPKWSDPNEKITQLGNHIFYANAR